MAFSMEQSTTKGKTLTYSDLQKISDQVASSLEASFSDIVFRDDKTGEEYQYTPSVDNHNHFAELFIKFLESRFHVEEDE